MGLFRRNKFEKLQREDVINAIIELENRETDLENSIFSKNKQIEEMMEKGRAEKNRDVQLFLAKKINFLKEEKEADTKRAMYLLYNIRLMKKLKEAIDDNSFVNNVGNVNINVLLKDQKGLAVFLNKALSNKIKAEDVLTSADEIFNEVSNSYEENQDIYGVKNQDDELLSMFEIGGEFDDAIDNKTLEKEKIDNIE